MVKCGIVGCWNDAPNSSGICREHTTYKDQVKIVKKSLVTQIAEVTVERDRLRAELDTFKENANKYRCSYCGEIGSDDMERVAKHMSECKARPENALIDEIDRLRAVLDERNQMLKALEWCYDEGVHTCPICGRWESRGHDNNCKLKQLLSPTVNGLPSDQKGNGGGR